MARNCYYYWGNCRFWPGGKQALGLGARLLGFCPRRDPITTPSPKLPVGGSLGRRPGGGRESDKGKACGNRGSLPLEEKVSQIEDFFMDRIICSCCYPITTMISHDGIGFFRVEWNVTNPTPSFLTVHANFWHTAIPGDEELLNVWFRHS